LSATENVVVADCCTDQEPAGRGMLYDMTWRSVYDREPEIRRPVLTVVAIGTCVVLDVHAVSSLGAPRSPSAGIVLWWYSADPGPIV